MERLQENEFTQLLDERYIRAMKDTTLSLIHGGLHQGNIMKSSSLYFIDWDSVQFSLPYQDFFHFSVISDYEKDPSFKNMKEEMRNRSKKENPSIKYEQLILIEFETYLGLLTIYYENIKNILPEFRDNILVSCKYLLEKSKDSLREYATITGDNELLEKYSVFVDRKFKKLLCVDFDESASISYAHTTNHRYRKRNSEEIAEKNMLQHQEKIEKIIIADERKRATKYAVVLGLSLLPTAVMFVLDNARISQAWHNQDWEYLDKVMEKSIYLSLATSIAAYFTASVIYNKEKISNYVSDIIKKLENSDLLTAVKNRFF